MAHCSEECSEIPQQSSISLAGIGDLPSLIIDMANCFSSTNLKSKHNFIKKQIIYLTISPDCFKENRLMAKPVVKQGRKATGLMKDSRVASASNFCIFSKFLIFH
jgi:hypothetical protein